LAEIRLRQRRGLIPSLMVLVFILVLGITFITWEFILSPLDTGEEVIVFIPPGSSASSIGDRLEAENVVGNSFIFLLLVRLQGIENQLKSGYYSFSSQDDLFNVIEKTTRGDVLTYTITVPEGLTMEEIALIIAELSGDFSKEEFLQTAEEIYLPYDYLPDDDFPGDYRLQGYLYPARYSIPRGTSPEQVIRKMVDRFDQEITEEMLKKAKEMGYSVHELVTIASLIEREAKLDEERPTISAVIHNRLEINMYLQIDATVQYALSEWKSRLLYEDLAVDSPYNTYIHPGLPPGPIASPGQKSLKAAFFPADEDYLYYVANPDGSHNFSRTYEEHLRFRRR